MNIIFITENLFPDVMGGSGRVVAETAGRLAARGHKVFVLTKRVGDTLPYENINGAEIRRYSGSLFGNHGSSSLSHAIRAATKETKFDIAVICQPLPGIAVLHHPCLKSTPKVRDFYGPWHDEYRVKRTGRGLKVHFGVQIGCLLRKLLDAHVLKNADMIRVLSLYTADIATDICPQASGCIRLIPAGVDTDRFAPAADKKTIRERLHLPGDRRIIFTMRNLTPRMGLDVLIEAMRDVADKVKEAVLIIGGEGPLRPALEQKIKNMNLERYVLLKGRIPDDDLPAFYQSADLFVLPTQELEGFGLVTLEALACGLPVLATPQGGSVEILNAMGKDFLFDAMDSTTMASRITEILDQPEKLAEMGRRARATILKTYSWDKQVDQLLALFEDALANRRRRQARKGVGQKT